MVLRLGGVVVYSKRLQIRGPRKVGWREQSRAQSGKRIAYHKRQRSDDDDEDENDENDEDENDEDSDIWVMIIDIY